MIEIVLQKILPFNSLLQKIEQLPEEYSVSSFSPDMALPKEKYVLFYTDLVETAEALGRLCSSEKHEVDQLTMARVDEALSSLNIKVSPFLRKYLVQLPLDFQYKFFDGVPTLYGEIGNRRVLCAPYGSEEAAFLSLYSAVVDASNLTVRTLSLFSLDETELPNLIKGLTSSTVRLKLQNVGWGEWRLRVYFDKDYAQSEQYICNLYKVLGNYIYADSDSTLSEVLVNMLSIRKKRLALAESLTGGMITSSIVSVAGASDVFVEGLTTYSNESKEFRLNIPKTLIDEYDAVSAETAYSMVAGLLDSGMCDYALSTTGMAGPTTTNLTKPVGLVYIAYGRRDEKITVKRFDFHGLRNEIRAQTTNSALFLLIRYLISN